MNSIQTIPGLQDHAKNTSPKFGGRVTYSGFRGNEAYTDGLSELIQNHPIYVSIIKINVEPSIFKLPYDLYEASFTSPVGETKVSDKDFLTMVRLANEAARKLIDQLAAMKKETERQEMRERTKRNIRSALEYLANNRVVRPREVIDFDQISDGELLQKSLELAAEVAKAKQAQRDEQAWEARERQTAEERARKIHEISTFQAFLKSKGKLDESRNIVLDQLTDPDTLRQVHGDLRARVLQACPRSLLRKKVNTGAFEKLYGFKP